MKSLLFLLFFGLFLSLLFSCSEDSINPNRNPGPSFIDQPLQGILGGQAWTFESGIVSSNTYIQNGDSIRSHVFFFSDTLLQVIDSSRGIILNPPDTFLTIGHPDGNPILQTGLINLPVLSSTSNPLNKSHIKVYGLDTAELYLQNGGFEIIVVDTAEMLVSGRLHAWSEDFSNEVNGNFTVGYISF